MASDFFRNCSEEFFSIEILIGKQLALTIMYRTLLYETTWHVNPLSILQRLSDVCLQKTGKKCWQVIFSQIPLKYIYISVPKVIFLQAPEFSG